MSAGARGRARERQFEKRLRADGWEVNRNTYGTYDLLACRGGEIRLIELKANLAGGAWMNFRRDERLALSAAAKRAGGRAFLVYWPPDRKPPRWLAESDWPRSKAESGQTA